MNNRQPFEQALTFDDVLLLPQKSNVLPTEVDLKTKLTNKIDLNIPILSAAMDTVTETEMAIAVSRLGGIGVIHKNLSIDDQVKMVDKVKRSESGMILNPITIDSSSSIAKAKNTYQMAEAMKYAVIAGRKSFLSGRIKKNIYGSSSSPKKGII